MSNEQKLREALRRIKHESASLADAQVIALEALSLPTQAKRDREADRARFPDTAFNTWLDESITENGEFTAWDSLSSTGDAYAGWSVRSNYAPTQAEPVEGGEVVAYRETITGRLCEPDDTHRRKFPMCYRPLAYADHATHGKPEPVDLEWPLERLVERCNNSADMASCDEVIAAEAALERLYKSRKKHEATPQPAPASAELPDEHLCPVCGGDWHSENCALGLEVSRRLAAEHEVSNLRNAVQSMLAIHDEPVGFAGKYGKELDALLKIQQVKVDAAITLARAALSAQAVPSALVLDALRDGLSVCTSVSICHDRKIVRDGVTLYAQTDDWCNWAESEVGPKLRSAIEHMTVVQAVPDERDKVDAERLPYRKAFSTLPPMPWKRRNIGGLIEVIDANGMPVLPWAAFDAAHPGCRSSFKKRNAIAMFIADMSALYVDLVGK